MYWDDRIVLPNKSLLNVREEISSLGVWQARNGCFALLVGQ